MKYSYAWIVLGVGSLLLGGCASYDSTVVVSLTGQTEAMGEAEVCVTVLYEAHCFGCGSVDGEACEAMVLDSDSEFVATMQIEPGSTNPSVDEPKSLTTRLRFNVEDSENVVEVEGVITEQSGFEPGGDGTSRISVKATYTP